MPTEDNLTVCLMITGLGAKCVDRCLDSILANPLPDDLLFVHDDVGRSLSSLDKLSPTILEDCYGPYNLMRIVHNNSPREKWAQCNQTVNLGMRSTDCGFALIGHEDQFWPHWDYAGAWKRALTFLADHNFTLHGKRIVGVVSPSYEVQREDEDPVHPEPVGLTQYMMAHTSLLSRKAWFEAGESSETNGIWWDARLQDEIIRRDWWLLYLRWPYIVHLGSKSNAAHDWSDKWKLAPQWGDFDRTWLAKYGYPFKRPRDSFMLCPEAAHLV